MTMLLLKLPKIIKTEFVNNQVFKSLSELQLLLADYVNWFNNHRIHSSLGYLTPSQFKTIDQKASYAIAHFFHLDFIILFVKCCIKSKHPIDESILIHQWEFLIILYHSLSNQQRLKSFLMVLISLINSINFFYKSILLALCKVDLLIFVITDTSL